MAFYCITRRMGNKHVRYANRPMSARRGGSEPVLTKDEDCWLKNLSVAVDIGGTFTDLLVFDPETGRIHQAKCLSTPPDFATGVLDGVRKAALDLRQAESF